MMTCYPPVSPFRYLQSMRISRVYTRTGDQGQTRLVGGKEVAKDDPRVEAYGDVDELNSVLGLARSFNRSSAASAEVQGEIDGLLKVVQSELFNLGGDLATPAEHRVEGMPRVTDADIERLERDCDRLNEELGPLEEFILPGGGVVGAFLHQGRTVCRRAERRVLTLSRQEEGIDPVCLRYLNRLSDFLFVLARWSARAEGVDEFSWQKPGDAPGGGGD